MKRLASLFIALTYATHTLTLASDKIVYQISPSGQIQYHKPSLTIQKDGRVIEADQSGQKMYHRQQYQIKSNQIYPVDSTGNIQENTPRGRYKSLQQ